MGQEIIGGDGDLCGQDGAHSLSRRDFLAAGAGAGAGLLFLGLGGYGPASEAQAVPLGALDVFARGYPRAFFFRYVEGEARAGDLSYAEWEKRYLPLGGIVGKVLNEAHYYTGKNNLQFFLDYKRENPNKMVLLHYNGTGRRATDESTTKFFAGHFLYYAGTKLTQAITSRTQTVLHVADTSVFSTKRYGIAVADDIAIARMGSNGRPNWETAEHVRLKSINRTQKTITVQRGMYNTHRNTYPGGAYLASHVTTGPYRFEDTPQQSVPLWAYNFSTVCPRPQQGRGPNCGEALANYLAAKLRPPDGQLSSFDGIVFDVFSWIIRFGYPIQDIDVNSDGRADRGIVGGVNVVSKGALEFVKALRERLPGKLILADGHIPRESQRGFGYLNGMESEGYPDKYDIRLDHLSRGENIFNYWKANGVSPSMNYVNYRYKQRKPEKYRNTFTEPTLSQDKSYRKLRLALASACFTESVFTYSGGDQLEGGAGGEGWLPPETEWSNAPGGPTRVRIFDELWKGTEQVTNWLGQPLLGERGGPKHLAARAPDLLTRQGENWPTVFVNRFSGQGVAFSRTDGAGGPLMTTRSTANRHPPAMTFTLPGINVTGQDLFVTLRLRGQALEGFPASVPRRVDVHAVRSGGSLEPVNKEFTWAGAEYFDATLYFQDVGPGTVSLRFDVEGEGQLYFKRMTAHSAADGRYREFQGGVVFANPSSRNYTFNLQSLLPGANLRRLRGSNNQDPQTNNGQPVGETLELFPKDGLFLVRAPT